MDQWIIWMHETKKAVIREKQIKAGELLNHIFYNILPEYGLALRENQVSLSYLMLEAMEEKKLALCEAEVGTGKTYAYLIAAMVYRLLYADRQPVVISTSTIALQEALTGEYISQVSDMLMEQGVIREPLTFAVRKGKKHYACDSRVKTYLLSIKHNNRPEDKELIETLTALFTGACSLDLDHLPLTNYVKERICVKHCPYTCKFYSICRYRRFLKKIDMGAMDFQIVNHNLVLADALSRKGGRTGVLPEYQILILDEAHKLPEAARQMYGITFESGELESLAASICRTVANRPQKREVTCLCEEMLCQNRRFFERLKASAGRQYDRDCVEVELSSPCFLTLKALERVLKSLILLFYTTDCKDKAYKRLSNRLEQEQEKITELLEDSRFICWLEYMGLEECRLYALPKPLDFLLHEDLWGKERTYLLTSATLSVGGDFSRFMHQTGIDLLGRNRILVTSKASPFHYRKLALLYLPKDLPFPNIRKKEYIKAVTDRLYRLIHQSHGHMLVLFTSYRMMDMVYGELSRRVIDFPLFSMGKGNLEAIQNFKKSGNGVLFASDSAGEGIDLAGDILSALVVVKLPFPAPDPVLEYEKSMYEDFHSYLSEIIVPAMLMKLRQWMGRGIRKETDTCVFSILDSRAAGKYRKDILSALPDMPVTEKITDVGAFIRRHKPRSYFVDEEENIKN